MQLKQKVRRFLALGTVIAFITSQPGRKEEWSSVGLACKAAVQ
jgi:hypothetical protein